MVRFQRPRGLEFWSIVWMIGGAAGTWLVLQLPLLWPLLIVTVPMFLFSALLWLGWRWPAWGLIVLFSLLSLLLVLGMLLDGVTFQGAFKLIATLVSIWELYQYWRGPQGEIEPEWLLAVEDPPWELESSELQDSSWEWEEEYDEDHESYPYEDFGPMDENRPGSHRDFRDDSWPEAAWDDPHRPWHNRRRADEPDWDWKG